MKRFVARVALGGTLGALLAGCGNSTGTVDQPIQLGSLNGVEYGILQRTTLTNSPTNLAGSGKVIFRAPRPAEDSNYQLTFQLEPQGALTLHTNADNKLTSGVTIGFARPATGPLKVTLAVGTERYDISSTYAAVAVDQAIRVDLDVHEHGHVVAFLGTAETPFGFVTRIAGRFWGLSLEKASVTAAVAAKAKDEHDE